MLKLNKIKEIIDTEGRKMTAIAEAVGLPYGTIRKTLKASTRPNYYVVEALSDYLEYGERYAD